MSLQGEESLNVALSKQGDGVKGLGVGDVDAGVEGRLEVFQVLVLDELHPLLLKRIWLHLCGPRSLHTTLDAHRHRDRVSDLDAVVAEGVVVLELLVVVDQALLVLRDALLVHDDCLDHVDGRVADDDDCDVLACGGLHEDLHLVVGIAHALALADALAVHALALADALVAHALALADELSGIFTMLVKAPCCDLVNNNSNINNNYSNMFKH